MPGRQNQAALSLPISAFSDDHLGGIHLWAFLADHLFKPQPQLTTDGHLDVDVHRGTQRGDYGKVSVGYSAIFEPGVKLPLLNHHCYAVDVRRNPYFCKSNYNTALFRCVR